MARKSVSREWMLRSIRGASVTDIHKIVERESFRNEEAFELLADRCKELYEQSPQVGLQAALLLYEFSLHLSIDAQGQALDILGSSYRRNGRYDKAQDAYKRALAMPIADEVRGGVLQRKAVLNLMELQFDDALMAINRSFEMLQGSALGCSFIVRSKIYGLKGDYKKSADDAGLGLTLLDCKKDQRWFISGVQSVAHALLAGTGSTEDLRAAYNLIDTVKRQLRGTGSGRYRSTGWIYLDWIEGQINGRLGSHRQAVRQLEKVRDRFYEVGGDCYLRDALLVSVDLAVVHDAMADSARAASECDAAVELARALGLQSEMSILSAYRARRAFVGLDREVRGIKV